MYIHWQWLIEVFRHLGMYNGQWKLQYHYFTGDTVVPSVLWDCAVDNGGSNFHCSLQGALYELVCIIIAKFFMIL